MLSFGPEGADTDDKEQLHFVRLARGRMLYSPIFPP